MTELLDYASRENWGDDHENAFSWCRVRNSCGFRLTSVRPSVQMERSLLRLPGLSGIRLWANAVPRPNSIVIKNYCEGKFLGPPKRKCKRERSTLVAPTDNRIPNQTIRQPLTSDQCFALTAPPVPGGAMTTYLQ